MRADELDCRARLRVARRRLVADLRYLGYEPADVVCRTLLELEALKARALRHLRAAGDRR